MSIKKHFFLASIILSFSCSNANSQSGKTYVENQIIQLILRLNDLKKNIVYDTSLLSESLLKTIKREDIESRFSDAHKIINENKMLEININRSRLFSRIPKKIPKKYIKTSSNLTLQNCTYSDKNFSKKMDSLSINISKENGNEKKYDSLTRLQMLALESTFAKLADNKCFLNAKKQFLLYKVFESNSLLLILYCLKIERAPDILEFSELIFKENFE